MTPRLLRLLLPLALVISCGSFQAEVFAGKIDLDNISTTTTTRSPSITVHLRQFSRFSLDGPTVETSFGTTSPLLGPERVSVFSLSDYGITTENIGQLGSLLQIRFDVDVCCTSSGSAFGQVSLFLIDPLNPSVKIPIGSQFVSTPLGAGTTTGVFSVSQFGTLPINITSDFFIGVTGFVGVNGSGLSGEASRLTILSTIPTPEPASILLVVSGLGGLGMLARKRRR